MPPKSRRDWQKSSLRVYEPGKRHMELIPSVSRSSGLDKDGDALRDHNVQQEYRKFIQEKLNDYWERFPCDKLLQNTKQREEVQGNLLILFRKLREGLLSTKRHDAFALEVYETSMYLSIIFNAPAQTTSIISHLIPTLYQSCPISPTNQTSSILLSLLHFLSAGYPSQSRYFEHLYSLPNSLFPAGHPMRIWIAELTRALRSRNYARLDRLTRREACTHLLEAQRHTVGVADGPNNQHSPADLPRIDLVLQALYALSDALRIKARETIWLVLRGAYRELSLPNPSASDVAPTRDWLCRSLILRPVTVALAESEDGVRLLDDWMSKKQALGDVRPREGIEGRWIVTNVKK